MSDASGFISAQEDSPFRVLQNRVKINPESYIKFDGSDRVWLQNILSADGVRIQPDILLILWDLVDWKSIGELTAPWPPEDQEKIIGHLAMLHHSKIVLLEGVDVPAEPSESGLAAHLGTKIHINLDNHHVMLRDVVRTSAYRRAIEQTVQPGDIAMDLGCGTGILGFFAARRGAKKVYSVERREDIALLAKSLAASNQLADIVEIVTGASSQLPAERFTPKPNVLIAEILGNGILEENVLEFTLDARKRFLAEGGQMIPWKLDIQCFGFEEQGRYGSHCNGNAAQLQAEVSALENLYGLDLTLYREVLSQKNTLRPERYQAVLQQAITPEITVRSLDFYTLQDSVFHQRFEVIPTQDGHLSGLCAYFTATLDKPSPPNVPTTLSNSPWAPSTHWTQLILSLAQPINVKKGQPVAFIMQYDGTLQIKPDTLQ